MSRQYVIVGYRNRVDLATQIKMRFGRIVPVIFPTETRLVRPRRRRIGKPIPIVKKLFYEYQILGWDEVKDIWLAVRVIPGLYGVLSRMEDGTPYLLSSQDLSSMMTQEDRGLRWEGAELRIVTGPLMNLEGEVKNGAMEIEMFGRKVRVKTDDTNLQKVA